MGTNFNDENYITIQGWMITRMKLSGNELICYALIFGFCQNKGAYNGSLAYLSEALNMSRSGTINILRKLMSKQYIEKVDEYENNVKFCRYRCTDVTKLNSGTDFGRGVVQNLDGGSTNFAPNNTNNNYIDNSIKKEGKPSKENPVGISPTPDEAESFSRRMGITAEGLGVRPQVIKKMDELFKRLVFPFDSDEFKRNFFALCCTKNWRGKEISAIQKQLELVEKYTEPFVMQLIDTSIANDWKALVYDSTDRKYEEYMRAGSAQAMGGTIITPLTQSQREMFEFDEKLKKGLI